MSKARFQYTLYLVVIIHKTFLGCLYFKGIGRWRHEVMQKQPQWPCFQYSFSSNKIYSSHMCLWLWRTILIYVKFKGQLRVIVLISKIIVRSKEQQKYMYITGVKNIYLVNLIIIMGFINWVQLNIWYKDLYTRFDTRISYTIWKALKCTISTIIVFSSILILQTEFDRLTEHKSLICETLWRIVD